MPKVITAKLVGIAYREGYTFACSDVGKVVCVGDARLEITRVRAFRMGYS